MYDGSINWMPPGMILSLKNTVIDPFIYRTRADSSSDHSAGQNLEFVESLFLVCCTLTSESLLYRACNGTLDRLNHCRT